MAAPQLPPTYTPKTGQNDIALGGIKVNATTVTKVIMSIRKI
jgi:hypothetical protein